MRYIISVKISSERTLNFNVGGYSNNEKRIRFQDERTGLLKNFPEEWCSIEEVREWILMFVNVIGVTNH